MPDRFSDLFLAGKAHNISAAHAAFGCEAAGPVEISGDAGTVPVRIFSGVLSPADGDNAKRQSQATEKTTTGHSSGLERSGRSSTRCWRERATASSRGPAGELAGD